MTRHLRAAGTQGEILPALRAALSGAGPALFAGEPTSSLPDTVPHNVALVVQSSGSTALPKRVALSPDALLASAAASEATLGGPGQWLLALPVTFIAGINVLVRSLSAGTEPVTLGSAGFDPTAFVGAATAMTHPLRFTSLVPAQLASLIDSGTALAALRRFDRILLGGQATPSQLLERAADLGISVTRTYGSTETSGGCVYDGHPIGGTVIRVVAGQVEVSGPTLAEGYLDDEERTSAAFHDEHGRRWYRTGDSGEFGDGVLSLHGRLDDVIVSGGIKVSLGEVERLLRTESLLRDAIVLGVADERWGEVPVVLSTTAVGLADLRQLVASRLGKAAAPARIVLLDAIPMLDSGKPDLVALRSAAAR